MSDLTDELLHMAADGAGKARPLGVAEVMRMGNRRRARTIGQRSLGGLSVLGVGAAVVMAGVLHPVHAPAGHPAASASGRSITLTETRLSSAGTITVDVRYRDAASNKVKLLSIKFAGKSNAVRKHAFVLIAFGRADTPGPSQSPACRTGKELGISLSVRITKDGSFVGTPSRQLIAWIDRHGELCGSQLMQVSLIKRGSAQSHPQDSHVDSGTVMTAGLLLNR